MGCNLLGLHLIRLFALKFSWRILLVSLHLLVVVPRHLFYSTVPLKIVHVFFPDELILRLKPLS